MHFTKNYSQNLSKSSCVAICAYLQSSFLTFTIFCHHYALSAWSMIFHHFRFSRSDNQLSILTFHLNQTTHIKSGFFQPISLKDDRWGSFIVVAACFIYFHFSKFLKCHNIASLDLPCFRLDSQTLYRI